LQVLSLERTLSSQRIPADVANLNFKLLDACVVISASHSAPHAEDGR